MKNTFIYIFLVISVLSFFFKGVVTISAHSGGVPYIKINGVYTQENPLRELSIPTSFFLGADIASDSGIIVDQSVLFEIDEQLFPNPYAQAQSPFGLPVTNQQNSVVPLFRWDYQDGTDKQEGKRVTHTFAKPGTYMVKLDAKFPGKTEDFTSVNTIQMTVAPSKDYELPQAVLTVNGQRINDSRGDTISIKPMTRISFDASASVGKIVKYQWVFGDEKGSDKKTTTHRFGRDEFFPTVLLRVTDEHNIISDSYVLLNVPFEKMNPIFSLYYKVADYLSNLFYKE